MKFLYPILIISVFASCNSGQISNGVLVSPSQLQLIRENAEQGLEPHYTNVKLLIEYVDELMGDAESWGTLDGEVVVAGRSSGNPVQISSTAGKLVYGATLAWHLTGEEKYAEKAKSLILDLTDTYGYRNAEREHFHWGAQGILNLARGGTPYIYAADLLENWDGWTAADKLGYQQWLRNVMYPKVAWASRFS